MDSIFFLSFFSFFLACFSFNICQVGPFSTLLVSSWDWNMLSFQRDEILVHLSHRLQFFRWSFQWCWGLTGFMIRGCVEENFSHSLSWIINRQTWNARQIASFNFFFLIQIDPESFMNVKAFEDSIQPNHCKTNILYLGGLIRGY